MNFPIIHQLGVLLARTDCPKKRAIIWDLYESVEDQKLGYNSYLMKY